jgi:hypothetical protein
MHFSLDGTTRATQLLHSGLVVSEGSGPCVMERARRPRPGM